MRLSTSTNMLYPVQRAEHSLDTIRTLGAAGFQVLDWCATAFSNQDTVRGENPFTTSEWQGWIGAQRNEADKLGIAFNQAHGSMYDYFAQDDHTAWLHQMTERIMQACVMLGIDTIIYHPYEAPGSRELQNIDACRRANVEYLRRAGDMAASMACASRWRICLAIAGWTAACSGATAPMPRSWWIWWMQSTWKMCRSAWMCVMRITWAKTCTIPSNCTASA